jgi:hypothetical protein
MPRTALLQQVTEQHGVAYCDAEYLREVSSLCAVYGPPSEISTPDSRARPHVRTRPSLALQLLSSVIRGIRESKKHARSDGFMTLNCARQRLLSAYM